MTGARESGGTISSPERFGPCAPAGSIATTQSTVRSIPGQLLPSTIEPRMAVGLAENRGGIRQQSLSEPG